MDLENEPLDEPAVEPGEPIRRRRRKPKEPDWHELVTVKNLTGRRIASPSGGVEGYQEGTMKRLDAVRLARFVEIVGG